MGIKSLRQCIDIHLEHIFRGVLFNAFQLAFIATGKTRFNVFLAGIVKTHGEYGIFQLALPNLIQARFVFRPWRIFAVHSHELFAIKSEVVEIVGNGIQRPGQAILKALLKAIENCEATFQFSLPELVIKYVVITLKILDVRCQEIQTIGVQIF